MGLTYIASVTASASATVSFTTGIDATYNEYQFHFVNMHPASDGVDFTFQVNASGLTGFNETITSSYFMAEHTESDSWTNFSYNTLRDQAQGTSYQHMTHQLGADADQALSGVLTLYAPSSTTYVKHFVSNTNAANAYDISQNAYAAGYINTTNAIDEISFKMSSGNIDAGTIHMYGVG